MPDISFVNTCSNVTGLIDRMEKAGWVERAADTADRRVKRLRLTADGRRLIQRAEEVKALMNPRASRSTNCSRVCAQN
ncbi:MAG: MarR family transcriptional regulator [Candidatus Sumerlaeota bacterium]|nr:MarR family transcriptional regulator [Candidatus Sumerlaeota bacterium]